MYYVESTYVRLLKKFTHTHTRRTHTPTVVHSVHICNPLKRLLECGVSTPYTLFGFTHTDTRTHTHTFAHSVHIHDPPKRLFECGISTPYTLSGLICTIGSELDYFRVFSPCE